LPAAFDRIDCAPADDVATTVLGDGLLRQVAIALAERAIDDFGIGYDICGYGSSMRLALLPTTLEPESLAV